MAKCNQLTSLPVKGLTYCRPAHVPSGAPTTRPAATTIYQLIILYYYDFHNDYDYGISGAPPSPSCSPSSCFDGGPVVDISQSLSIHSHLSLAQAQILESDHSVFGSHWRW